MIINKKINDTLSEISIKSVEYGNSPESRRLYMKRMLKIFNESLSEEERIFFLSYVLDNLHYKNILIDPETMLTANNIKLRSFFLIFTVICLAEILVLFLFQKEIFFKDGFKVVESLLKFMSL